MQRKTAFKTLTLAVMAAWAGGASASGFQLIEQNASGIGNAFAGSAAVAENASTVFYNPAGMTQLVGTNVSGGVAAVKPSFKFQNEASSAGSLNSTGNGGDGGTLGFVPNAYLTTAITKDLYFGLGIGAPFGLKTEYNDPWIGGAQSLSFEITTINVNPSLAYKVNDVVSLGFGANWQKLDATYKRIVGTYNALTPVTASTTGIHAVLDVNDDAWGWNAGALFNISPSTKLGVSYRSTVKYTATGDIKLSSDGSALATGTMTTLNGYGASSNVKADIKLPDTWIVSASQKLDNTWELLGDISWTGWSSIPKLDIVRTSGVASGTTAQTLDTDFRDTWRFAIGANYQLNQATKLKFGLAYDQTPVKGADTRLVSLPDNDRTWFSFGAQWLPTKASTVDVGVAYLYVKDAPINNNQNNATNPTLSRGLVNGTYNNSAWILGLQYSAAF